jgi:subtilase family serine protease
MRLDPRSKSRSLFTLLACLTLLVGVLSSSAAGRSPSSPGALRLLHGASQAVCPGPASPGHALCTSRVFPDASSSPVGLTPAQMKAAYGFTTSATAGAGHTIAIVDAYNLPTAESDLNTFSSQFGLPACTTASGCFTKVNQTGGTKYPRYNSGWGLEIALDIEWAHAIAPGANILLVEASSNSFANLLAAEDYAKTHAQYVSNSWGASEFSSEASYDSHFARSGVSFFVSAGDAGLPADYPSASPNVISVGGTTLHFDGGGTFTNETGWSGGGGGCSVYENATAAQSGFSGYSQANCGGRRATPDLSLDADPNSGAAVYDGSRYQGQTGWYQVGGTSLSSPMVAGRAAVSGAIVSSAYVYGNSITFRDIKVGNNGAPCLVGFDLCSGRGSWTA